MNAFIKLNKYWDGFLHLLFPAQCLCCENELVQSENSCCSICLNELPFTRFELYKEPTDLDKLFWGRVPVHGAFSLLYYEKTNTVKPILQALKYKGRSKVGLEFGEMLGKVVRQQEKFADVDLLVPVPLHPKKRYTRGYNQSEVLAKGMSKVWEVPIETKLVSKSQHTKSQTKLGRFMRWDNVEDLFYVQSLNYPIKHIAIVDDVITTGATLESMIRSIREIYPEIRISVISLAVTK